MAIIFHGNYVALAVRPSFAEFPKNGERVQAVLYIGFIACVFWNLLDELTDVINRKASQVMLVAPADSGIVAITK